MHASRVITIGLWLLAAPFDGLGSAPIDSPPALSTNVLRIVELQTALVRDGISPGPIDGLMGGQTVSALRAFQQKRGLRITGTLDDNTRTNLPLVSPLLATY